MKRSDLTAIILDKILSDTLKGTGTILRSPSKERFIKVKASREVTFEIFFDLTNNQPPYHFFEGVGLEHKNISSIIQEILSNAGIALDWVCYTGTHVRNYWPSGDPVTVSTAKDIDEFLLSYNEAFFALKKDFLDKYKEINTFIHDCTLFYTKWPKSMMPQDVGFSLIGFGILNNNIKYISDGKELLIKKKAQLTGLPKILHDSIDIIIDYANKSY